MLTIRALAARTGVPSKTLRYWESRGLVPRPGRSHTGYRLYEPLALRRIQFIRKAKSIGFTLSEIKQLLARKGSNCEALDAWTAKKLEVLDQQIKTLTRLRDELARHRRRWRGRLPCPPMSPDEICCLIEELPDPDEERR